MAVELEKIIFEDLPSTNTPINSSNLNKMQSNIEEAINANGSVSDIEEVTDKTKVAPSIRLTQEMINKQMKTETWQPDLSVLNEIAPTVTYEYQNGVYTKIGNLVFINFHIRGKVTKLNGTNNYILISNLPLPNKNSDYGNIASTVNLSLIMGLLSNDIADPSGYIDSNGIRIISITSGNFGKMKVTDGTRFDFRGAGWYYTDP